MVPFSPVTTQNRVCLSGQRHDWVPATPHPPSSIKADVTPMGSSLHLKMNPPLKMNLPFIEILSPLSRNDSWKKI